MPYYLSHIEGPPTVLGITLNYISLRILGVPADHPIMVKARGNLHKLGGATHAPQWAVFWMCIMNVYDWEGCNPIPPEFWLVRTNIKTVFAGHVVHCICIHTDGKRIFGTQAQTDGAGLGLDRSCTSIPTSVHGYSSQSRSSSFSRCSPTAPCIL